MLLQYYSVLQSTTPVLLCTTKYYSSTTLYYKVLLHYYFVLHSATPVLLCTTPVLLCTTLYYKVLLQYYSVLHSTTPVLLVLLQYYSVLQSTTLYYKVLLCTTKYYSSTTKYYSSTSLYYKVLLQYYKVLLCTTPVLLWTTQYYSSSPVLLSTTKYYSSTTLYYSWLILVTHATLFTMHGATSVIVQTHQILRLPRKMNLMIDQHDIWNAIYIARNNRWHPPTSPNTAPATQNDCHDWSSSHMKRYLKGAEQQVASSNITKYCACHAKWFSKISQTFLQNRWNVNCNARPIRAGSDHDPSWIRAGNRHPQPASQPRLLFRTTTTFLYWKIQHFALRLSFQISPNAAPATKSDTSTSPNTAPATQNDSHHWSSWHVTRHLQCAAQQHSPSDLTKYCACHAKWNSWLISMT